MTRKYDELQHITRYIRSFASLAAGTTQSLHAPHLDIRIA
jgi:hypothetical protein